MKNKLLAAALANKAATRCWVCSHPLRKEIEECIVKVGVRPTVPVLRAEGHTATRDKLHYHYSNHMEGK